MGKQEKIAQVTKLQGELLREYCVGHPEWYAEMLACAFLDGQMAPTNTPNHDVVCKLFGRVQVKCRVDGTDTTQNRTNFGKYKTTDFDHAVIVIFESDYRIKGAVILPSPDVLGLVRPAGHVKWQDVKSHTNARCIKVQLQEISGELT